MKKIFLLIALLMSVLPVCAVNWEMIETGIPNLDLYIDTASLIYINNDECFYAIRYKAGDKQEKIAYIKSNSSTDYIGVIQTADYGIDTYKPYTVFKNAHVFMKPIKKDSFLSYSHKYSTTAQNSETVAQETSVPAEDNIKEVSYSLFDNMEDYLSHTAVALNSNWNPPKSARNTQTIVIITVGIDGSLQNYRFAQSSGNDATDRSVISAVEKTAPFMKFPRSAANTRPANFQFVFDNKLFRKSVI